MYNKKADVRRHPLQELVRNSSDVRHCTRAISYSD